MNSSTINAANCNAQFKIIGGSKLSIEPVVAPMRSSSVLSTSASFNSRTLTVSATGQYPPRGKISGSAAWCRSASARSRSAERAACAGSLASFSSDAGSWCSPVYASDRSIAPRSGGRTAVVPWRYRRSCVASTPARVWRWPARRRGRRRRRWGSSGCGAPPAPTPTRRF